MSRKLTASDRSALIRLASSMEKGSPERKAILAGLKKAANEDTPKVLRDAAEELISMGSLFKRLGYPVEIKDVFEHFEGEKPHISMRFEHNLEGGTNQRPYFCDVYVRIDPDGKPFYIADPFGNRNRTVSPDAKTALLTVQHRLFPFGEPKGVDELAEEVHRSFEQQFGKVKAVKTKDGGLSWSLSGDEMSERGMRTDVQNIPKAVSGEYDTWRSLGRQYRHTADPRIVYSEAAMGGGRGMNDFKKVWSVGMTKTFPKITL